VLPSLGGFDSLSARETPHRGGNRSGDQQQNHAHILKLREELSPRRNRLSAVNSLRP
jgi:hypothetical protein